MLLEGRLRAAVRLARMNKRDLRCGVHALALTALTLGVGCGAEPEPAEAVALGVSSSPVVTGAADVAAETSPDSQIGMTRRQRLLHQVCPSWRSLRGTWLSPAYGLALQASSDEFVLYDVSESSCFETFRGPIAALCRPTLRVDFGSEQVPYRVIGKAEVFGPYMVLRDSGTVRYPFERAAEVPRACADGGTPESANPVQNFELLWEHMNEHYAFFALRGVDWQAQYARYRPLVSEATTPEALAQIMAEMLAPLSDYHVSLTTESARFSRPAPQEIRDNAPAIQAYLAAHYLAAPEAQVTANGLVAYRRLTPDVGYVMINGMNGFADASVLATSEDAIVSEVELAGAAIDQALLTLADTRSLIVDVRFNPGGTDAVALAIAGRFADRTRFAWSKVARVGEGTTWPSLFFVEPAGAPAPQKPVLLLTSAVTLSAAETFTMAMRVLPNVVVLGEPTAGAHSDVMTRMLPNGWELGLSNEIFRAADGEIYERVGIPPDIAVALEPTAFGQGRDAIVEAALGYLRSR
jgi:carboxyl-terminal processing protease